MNGAFIIAQPQAPAWRFTLAAPSSHSAWFYVPTAPNRFHRLMQRALLGITWEKL